MLIRAQRMALACALFLGVAAAAQEDVVRIESVGAADERFRIALPDFYSEPNAAAYGRMLTTVLRNDLEFTGLVKLVPASEYPGSFSGTSPDPARIVFNDWRETPAEYLAYGAARLQGAEVVMETRLFDVLVAQQVVGKRLKADQKWARLIGHQFADEAIRFLTGVPGIATTEICFSGGVPGNKEIYIADYDGASVRKVTAHESISIRPKFSPDGRRIAYLSYKDRFPFIYVYDRVTGLSEPFSKHVGLNHAPSWSPDGDTLAYVLSKDGNTEIYMKRVGGNNEQRLTRNRSSDTGPVFSPDGRQIAFVSDRGGRPQIYVMKSDGSDVRRLSYQGGNSYGPAWSPDGRYIAYVVEGRGHGLEIYIMNSDGSEARQLTDAPGSSESPSWSPDSRHVVFSSRRSGLSQLFTVTVETGVVRQIPNLSHLGCEGPSWGPRRN